MLKFNYLSMFLAFILLLGILPATNVMGLTLPWQYIVIPILIFVVLFIAFKWIQIPKIASVLIALWLLIMHLNYMLRENYASKRISGVAHHATANGGIAVLLPLYKIWGGASFFNSQNHWETRAMNYEIHSYNKVYRKSLRSTIFMIFILGMVSGSIYWLYQRGNEFIARALHRWEQLEGQVLEGGNRIGQVSYAVEQLNHPFEYLFGISRGVQNAMDSFYIEVEPINIFVLYGAVGFILQYSLILILLIYFYKKYLLLEIILFYLRW